MPTTAEHWDALHQTERLAILTNIEMPNGPKNVAEYSRVPFDELPLEVQDDLKLLTWRKWL